MYDFAPSHRAALVRFAPTSRLVIERWVELTYEDTHPYWRSHPTNPELSAPCNLLAEALACGNLDAIPHRVKAVSGALLAAGFGRDWQYNAVKRYLLDPERKFSNEPFVDRVRRLALGESSQIPEAFSQSVQLEWRISEHLPANAKLPWRDPSVRLGDNPRDYHVLERGKASQRQWLVTTTVDQDLSRKINHAAAALKSDAAALLDLFRIAYGDPGAFSSHQIEVQNSAKMSYVRPKPFPRVRSRTRARRATLRILQLLQSQPDSSSARSLVGACSWLSTALIRWPENPRFATGLLWMALESLFSGCIIRHGRKCGHHQTLTALELYVTTLQDSLANELDDYIRHLRGTEADWKKNNRNPPSWCRMSVVRNARPSREWLADLITKIAASDEEEPLLVWHAKELLNFAPDMNEASAATANHLNQLRRMRNSVAHEGDPLLAEEETDFLAALGAELLFIAFAKA